MNGTSGGFMAIANVAALFEGNLLEPYLPVLRLEQRHGNGEPGFNAKPISDEGETSVIWRSPVLSDSAAVLQYRDLAKDKFDDIKLRLTMKLTFQTLSVALNRPKDSHVLSQVHIVFALLWTLLSDQHLIEHSEHDIPWLDNGKYLNGLLTHEDTSTSIWREGVLWHNVGRERLFPKPLPEEFQIRGLAWSYRYFPRDWLGPKSEAQRGTTFGDTICACGKARASIMAGLADC